MVIAELKYLNYNPENMKLSRRKFIGNGTALAALSIVPASALKGAVMKEPAISPVPVPAPVPDSNFGGVQIGAITYSWRSMPGGIENIIKYCRQSGLSSIELMSGDLESWLGAPENPMAGMFGPPPQAGGQRPPGTPGQQPTGTPGQRPPGTPGQQPAGTPGQRPRRTPEQEAAITKYNQDLKDWRLSLPMSRVEQARKLFNDAGIKVHIVKFSPARWSDEEIDYAFRAAKAMGAGGVTEEIGEEAVAKLGPAAHKHGMYAIFHNHMQFATPGFSYDPFLAVSPAVMMNFDAGHFFGSTGIHPNSIIEKYHDRIYSIHLKDKTGPETDPANTNQVWGQGEVPIADILLLLKKQKWPINVDIELEYDIKPWSDAVKETKICTGFARQILI
ncbi:MAG: sugar phosphate isomerase/epimerase [Bacteroidales bacterium]|jgi:sugar phosphate isomerase/epimerase|nr:sugar phosphate isomerase/epimerase [Bacteroidales bacterium]